MKKAITKQASKILINYLDEKGKQLLEKFDRFNFKLGAKQAFENEYVNLAKEIILIGNFHKDATNSISKFVYQTTSYNGSSKHCKNLQKDDFLENGNLINLKVYEVSMLYAKVYAKAFKEDTLHVNLIGFKEMYMYLLDNLTDIKIESKDAAYAARFILNGFFRIMLSKTKEFKVSEKSIDPLEKFYSDLFKYVGRENFMFAFTDVFAFRTFSKIDSSFSFRLFMNEYEIDFIEENHYGDKEFDPLKISRGFESFIKSSRQLV